MNSRRLIVAPRGQKPRTASSHSRPGLGTGRGGCELRPIVLGWECRLRVPRPGQNRKGSESGKCFPLCPRKRTTLPILELLPPPAFGERPHRGLARHLVAVHRLTIFVGQDGPQPWRSNRGRCCFHDAADDGTISEHVEIAVVPLAG